MLTPELTVAAIVERNGRFLMVEEDVDARAVINQPAGHVEPGESFEQAAIRETREETAWRLRPTAFVGVYLWRVPAATKHILRVVLCGEVDEQDADPSLDTGIIATHWLDYEALAARRDRLRSPLVLRGIDDYLAGRRYPLSLAARIGPELA